MNTIERSALVSRYATPFAIVLVAMGLLFSQPRGDVWRACLYLLASGIGLNLMMHAYFKKGFATPALIWTRLAMNVVINSLLVYFLGNYWGPTWLLLALTPIATAIYGTRESTLKWAIGIAALLLAIHYVRGGGGPLYWGEQAANALFIVFVSLLINAMAASKA